MQRIKTDHGSEFGTDFTWHLYDLGVAHRRIPGGSPERNGEVERSHRTDKEEFYRRVTQELRRLLRTWEQEYNHQRPHLALQGKNIAP